MLAAESKVLPLAQPVAVLPDTPCDWKHLVQPLEPFLQAVAQRLADQVQTFDADLACYAEYALTNQGKQLRPALVGLSAGATGQINDDHVTVAVIIEMVHLATLVHDDVMDEATKRRGRPTLAANWGNEISVLLGDCLFAHALELAASFPTPDICRAVASATNTVCSGEILQTQQRCNFQIARSDYFKVLAMKTGELFALSCDMGAYLSHASEAHRTALRKFGLALGTAYQVYDDCLDLFGREETAGKSLGTDLAKGKLTLPLLVVLESAPSAVQEKLKAFIREWRPLYFPQVLSMLKRFSALGVSQEVIRGCLRDARLLLACLPESPSRTALLGLSEFLGRQTESLGDA
ncbi:MAG: polyprenyl synthetase family protein [Verrucomicrobia bacterium]|nr:polyprenyl synthetase family protein [Verrucomicrobiota bacterium]